MNHFCQEDIDDIFKDNVESESSDSDCLDNSTTSSESDFYEENDTDILSQRFNNTKNSNIPLVEKYRPKKLDDVVQQDEIIKVLKNILVSGEMPHLLFHGGPGTGKTSTILALVLQLFGPNIVHRRVIELNASDERGIGTVRNKIISFTKTAIGSKDEKYPCPDFKIVILDEADAMTPEAQEALRKVMEKNCRITRFCFICNYINEIIDPIASRCTQFRFKPLDKNAVINKITDISKNENIKIDNKCVEKIYEISEGDLRRAIMILQNTKYIKNEKITTDDIIKITGGVENVHLKKFWEICCTGNCVDVRNLTLKLQRQGYQVKYVLNYLKICVVSSNLSDINKSKIMLEMCKIDKMLTEGSDEYLNMLSILLFTNNIAKKTNQTNLISLAK